MEAGRLMKLLPSRASTSMASVSEVISWHKMAAEAPAIWVHILGSRMDICFNMQSSEHILGEELEEI